MSKELKKELAEARAIIEALQHEVAESSRGTMALILELESKAAELERVNEALERDIAERITLSPEPPSRFTTVPASSR